LATPDAWDFVWALGARDDIDLRWISEAGEPDLPGRVQMQDADREADQLPFTVITDTGVSYQAVWPLGQWEQWAAQRSLPGVDPAAWRLDVLTARVAVAMRADLLVTDSPLLLTATDRAITEANPVSADQALASMGLYLRRRSEYPVVAPNRLTFDERGLLWSAVRAQLPAGWRWSSALVTFSVAAQRRGPTLLHGSLYQRLVRALRYRDQVHAAAHAIANNTAADDITEAFDNLTVNAVGAFDACARAAHLCANLPATARHQAKWQNARWRSQVARVAPDLTRLVDDGTDTSHLFHALRLLRNTVHGEALHTTLVRRVGGEPTRALIALPEEDSEDLITLFDRLGDCEEWGIVDIPSLGAHLDAALFVERLMTKLFAAINEIQARTPVQLLPGVTAASITSQPPEDLMFGSGTRRRVSLLLGLAPET